MLRGLTDVPSGAIKTLLGLAYREQVVFPLTITELTRVGLQYCALDLLAHLRTLQAEAAIAVLTAVVAERQAAARAMAGEREAVARSAEVRRGQDADGASDAG